MTNKLVVTLACLGLTAAAGAEVKFDQGVDVKSAIEQAKSSDVKGPYPYYGHNRVRYSKDCRNFNFGPSQFAQTSERAHLTSTEYIEVCRFIPDPPKPPPLPPHVNPNPNGPKPPNHGGHTPPPQPGHTPGHPTPPGHQPGHNPGHPKDYNPGHNGSDYGPHGNYTYPGNQNGRPGSWTCHERRGQSFRASAQLNVAPRQLYPWESESFSVCMEADRVSFDQRNSPYRYHVDQQGMYDINFNLTPNYRTPTRPDESGLYATGFSFQDGKFVLNVGDKWAAEYAGERVAIKVELVKDGFLFFNSDMGEKTFTLDAATGYTLAFAENELTKTKALVDDSADTRGPKKYYVKWGFRRIGSISTNDYMDKGKTDKITK